MAFLPFTANMALLIGVTVVLVKGVIAATTPMGLATFTIPVFSSLSMMPTLFFPFRLFQMMERKLLRLIMNPAMTATWIFGLALVFKLAGRLIPDYDWWREFSYESVFDKLAIDVINGSSLLREWVDDADSIASDLDALTVPDEQAGIAERATHLI